MEAKIENKYLVTIERFGGQQPIMLEFDNYSFSGSQSQQDQAVEAMSKTLVRSKDVSKVSVFHKQDSDHPFTWKFDTVNTKSIIK